jgi:muramoyltetrapeptide carboxypeptidase LdcA involved in peptidoglycan recycling
MGNTAARRIHLTAVGSPAGKQLRRLGIRTGKQLIDRVHTAVAPGYQVTADSALIWASEKDASGGRWDDRARVRAVEKLLGDDRVAALVTVRGGAWFARLVDRIDWDLLKHRRKTLYIFGFSEMTPLIAIAGRHPRVVGLYDLGPAFLYGGMKRYAQRHFVKLGGRRGASENQRRAFASGWAAAEGQRAFVEFFRDVANICNGKPSARVPQGRLLAGTLRPRQSIKIVGGNLSLMCALLGSSFRSAIDQQGAWLAIEEINEPIDNVDRMLAGLKLAGLFDRTKGILLGDFHQDDRNQSRAVQTLIKYHLPTGRKIPIIRLDHFGHIYPIAPLPMHRPITLRCQRRASGPSKITLEIPWDQW